MEEERGKRIIITKLKTQSLKLCVNFLYFLEKLSAAISQNEGDYEVHRCHSDKGNYQMKRHQHTDDKTCNNTGSGEEGDKQEIENNYNLFLVCTTEDFLKKQVDSDNEKSEADSRKCHTHNIAESHKADKIHRQTAEDAL